MSRINIFKNKNILVTGGCGSIGSEIVRQLFRLDPKVVRVFERSESAHFRLSQEIQSKKLRPLIGDIRDKRRVDRAMEGIDIVFHAAAMKHVPLCEYNPFEAITVNVLGTQNLVDAALEQGVSRFIGISTDKAVNPTSTMGATKLLGEKIISNASISSGGRTRFGCVRFGNVLASSGSIIPLFESQIRDSGTITITSKEMTRFFMSIPDAVELVLRAAESARRGEIFILKMNAMKIIDLAEVLVEELAGRYGKNPKDIRFKIIGVRPGEKEHEPLFTAEEAAHLSEEDGMHVLHNPTLSVYGIKVPQSTKKSSAYHSGTVPHMSKDEIRALLYDKKIILPQ